MISGISKLDCLHVFKQGILDEWKVWVCYNFNLPRISVLLFFLLFRVFFEAHTLLSNMAANLNNQMEIRQETFLSSSQNTREKNPAFSIYSYIVRFNIKLYNYHI